jgi:hypothetical protein
LEPPPNSVLEIVELCTGRKRRRRRRRRRKRYS